MLCCHVIRVHMRATSDSLMNNIQDYLFNAFYNTIVSKIDLYFRNSI